MAHGLYTKSDLFGFCQVAVIRIILTHRLYSSSKANKLWIGETFQVHF